MSLRSVSTRAAWRDSSSHEGVAMVRSTVGAPTKVGDSTLASATGALIDSVPTEVLVPYTAIISIVITNVGKHDSLLQMRWSIFAVSLAMIPLYLYVSFRRSRDVNSPRKVPVAEIVASSIAFVAWALAMPGSPLKPDLSRIYFTITSALLVLSGGFLIALIAPTLAKKAS